MTCQDTYQLKEMQAKAQLYEEIEHALEVLAVSDLVNLLEDVTQKLRASLDSIIGENNE